ncbi:SDR family NAD(P)-dependent oxidoreductase [Stutzerimonas stutzeri]|uniref:SDR family NAD(P)-dependent oxidoreductase n=1 Tax=Stutzerimonas stutzeri TaxID=316 RepID=UPI002108EABC|nr:SDR family NAD(P)-dependent oxidoreductase [Stutzerimonas stutzeri]MCQ4321643.1 SDR family oxidoreductase [Stutzerimonas stutzeri]
MRLKNKLAVITAAASGMGRAGVEIFSNEGARVAAIDLNEEGLASLKEEMKGKGIDIVTITADLSTESGARDSLNAAAKALGGLDVLWAHAGIPGPAGIEQVDMAAFRKSIAVNVEAAVIGAGEAVGYMRKRGGGSIIFTSSISGLVGSMWSPLYSAAKFGVVGLAKSLCQTYASDNVRVNVICPGLTDTPMALEFTSRKGDPEEAARNKEMMIGSVPLKRLGRPQDMAQAALWLASDESAYVTGVALPVDGGFTAK